MPTITQTGYGHYTHGRPRRSTYGSSWRRCDKYTSATGETGCDVLFVVNSSDDSPIFMGKYDPKCQSCWLNHVHSEAYHNRNIG